MLATKSKWVSEDSKKKKSNYFSSKNNFVEFFSQICSLAFFLIILDSSETYADPSRNEIGEKVDFS